MVGRTARYGFRPSFLSKPHSRHPALDAGSRLSCWAVGAGKAAGPRVKHGATAVMGWGPNCPVLKRQAAIADVRAGFGGSSFLRSMGYFTDELFIGSL